MVGLDWGSSGLAVMRGDAPYWMSEDIHQNRIIPPGVLKTLSLPGSLANPISDIGSCVVPRLQTHYVVENDLKLQILSSPSPKFQDCKCASLHRLSAHKANSVY